MYVTEVLESEYLFISMEKQEEKEKETSLSAFPNS